MPFNPFTQEKGERRHLYICCHVRRVEVTENEYDSDEEVMITQKKVMKDSPTKPKEISKTPKGRRSSRLEHSNSIKQNVDMEARTKLNL